MILQVQSVGYDTRRDTEGIESHNQSQERSGHSSKRGTSRRSSTVIIDVDVLYRVNYLMDELHGDTRDGSFCFGESTLQCAQRHSCFLCGYSREKLWKSWIRRHSSGSGTKKINHTEASAGRTTESKSEVSGNSASPFPFCPS